MDKDLTPQDFLDCGYKQFKDHLKNSSFGLQKKFTDNLGVKYFITVYVYENFNLPRWNEYKDHMSKYGFSPDLQIRRDEIGKPTLDIQVFMEKNSTVQWLENEVNDLWLALGGDYYELYYTAE